MLGIQYVDTDAAQLIIDGLLTSWRLKTPLTVLGTEIDGYHCWHRVIIIEIVPEDRQADGQHTPVCDT